MDLGELREIELRLFDCVSAVQFELVVAFDDDGRAGMVTGERSLLILMEENLILQHSIILGGVGIINRAKCN